MKSVLVAALFAVGVLAQSPNAPVTAPQKNYNVTRPYANYPYVIGQILPCVYDLLNVDTSSLQLTITLSQANNASAPPYVITNNADVSKTAQWLQSSGNVSFWEHQINYNIPTNATAGNYVVTYTDTSTQTYVKIPITINAAVSATMIPSMASASGSASASSGGASGSGTGAIPQASGNSLSGASGLRLSIAAGAVTAVAGIFIALF
ncbi:hypothetical protein BZG36_01557 [Bifiguratus adelaidae]|uniref:Uncharacterized protein n=1 Tax=Bifiguratus adelaidae TaxID=1938954 RepID=A0A261Y450_9FUNG|nr:hypothetical protein BZG36_01557 [Bifiguratus adelaidae]